MNKGISEYEKYKVIRPIIGESKYDVNGFPIISKSNLESQRWENINVVGIQNAAPEDINNNSLLLMFNDDYRLLRMWNNPLKYVALFQTYYAISTPGFSFSPDMNINVIRNNVFMSRWLGKTWQNYGCNVYPTIGWCLPDTYDICLSAVEEESIVVISTLGCKNNREIFLKGFNEMKKRLKPRLIIVYGDMIEGMTGRFVNFRYKDVLNTKYYQYHLQGISQIFEIGEVA